MNASSKESRKQSACLKLNGRGDDALEDAAYRDCLPGLPASLRRRLEDIRGRIEDIEKARSEAWSEPKLNNTYDVSYDDLIRQLLESYYEPYDVRLLRLGLPEQEYDAVAAHKTRKRKRNHERDPER